MNWLTISQQNAIRRLACSTPEVETCGFVLTSGDVAQVPNAAADPRNFFSIAPEDYAAYDDLGIAGVWHSHITEPDFSPADQTVMRTDSLPWAVFCLATDTFSQANPGVVAPFIGRPFVYGLYDCYSLVSDFLSDLGVTMPTWQRGPWGEWDTPEFVPFDNEAHNQGVEVTDDNYRTGDIICFNLGQYPNHIDHIGVFNSTTTFLHHLAQKKSRLDRFSPYWKEHVKCIIRPHQLWNA
jgi:proteasome lid subunit RPN8/RPN11